jgi:hypothetical protein
VQGELALIAKIITHRLQNEMLENEKCQVQGELALTTI